MNIDNKYIKNNITIFAKKDYNVLRDKNERGEVVTLWTKQKENGR